MTNPPIRSGFIAIIGRPNVGKSTLMNNLIGRKVSIMSDKPQTTRNRILAVLNTDQGQAIFLDTPGIHKPKHKLGEYMTETAQRTLNEVDLILYVVDATAKFGSGEEFILEKLKGVKTPVFLAINKIDLLAKPEILPLIDQYRQRFPFKEIIPISALKKENLESLKEVIFSILPEGPRYYPEDMVTDQPESFLAAEIIREKILHLTREEIPHTIAVAIEQMLPRKHDLLYINALIYTEKESQKRIIIGESGKLLREIGRLAREELEALFGMKVFLELWVKVKPDWRNKEGLLRGFGFSRDM